jgi:N-alpha-acetyl-L-2,4-diaminobutyrate deacetylase
MVDLGEPVEEDKVLARVHSVDRTGVASQEIRAKMSGLLAARHFPGLVKAGECAAVVAVEV